MSDRCPGDRQAPDWPFWLRRDRWGLWEAVNLALECEPPPPPDPRQPPPYCDERVAELLASAVSCEGVSLAVHRPRADGSVVLGAYVLAGDFARWLAGKGLEVPGGMRPLLAPDFDLDQLGDTHRLLLSALDREGQLGCDQLAATAGVDAKTARPARVQLEGWKLVELVSGPKGPRRLSPLGKQVTRLAPPR